VRLKSRLMAGAILSFGAFWALVLGHPTGSLGSQAGPVRAATLAQRTQAPVAALSPSGQAQAPSAAQASNGSVAPAAASRPTNATAQAPVLSSSGS